MCSISPESYRFERSYKASYVVPACAQGEVFASLWIEDAEDMKMVYHGIAKRDHEAIPVHIPAMDIAKDLMQASTLEREGVWICESGIPSEQEIQSARDKRTAYLITCVDAGDKLYAKYGQKGLDQIPDNYKRAVRELREERDWVLGVLRQKSECPGCGTMVAALRNGKPPAYCPQCKSVLNVEAARELKELQASIKAAPKPAVQFKTKEEYQAEQKTE